MSTFNPGRLFIALFATGLILGASFLPWANKPEAVALKKTLQEDSEVEVLLVGKGDFDRFEVLERPKWGRLFGTPPNLVYRPNKDFFGEDRFSYRVVAEETSSAPVEVSLKVLGVNDKPAPVSAKIHVEKNQPTQLELSAVDPDGDSVTYHLIQSPSHGTLSGTPPFLTYHPAPGFLGPDRLIFTAADGSGIGAEATLQIEVEKPNLAPTAFEGSVVLLKNQTKKLYLKAEDPEQQPLRFEIVDLPSKGKLQYQEDAWQYTPQIGYTGPDRFSFRVFDGRKWSQVAEVDLQVEIGARTLALVQSLKEMIKEGGVGIGDQRSPELMLGDQQYIPASVLKLATAVTALETLGPKHQFKTLVFLDAKRNLIIKGYGDPGFGADDWAKMADQLAAKGVFKQPIRHLMLDLSAYEQRPDFDGRDLSIEPYDAPIGPLMTNENLVAVRVKRGGQIKNLTSDTPLTKSILRKARKLPPGMQYFNLASTPKEGARYSLAVAKYAFEKKEMILQGKTRMGEAHAGLKPILTYHGEQKLVDLVTRMLHRSSNYIANQLVMALSLELFGEPAKMDLGVYMIADFLERKVGLAPGDFVMAEGSGLSRANSVTLGSMLKLVNYFEPYKNLLPSLSESHSSEIAAATGDAQVLAKTGTLHGVANLAGFIKTPSGDYKPFVILLSGGKQDRADVLKLLVETYAHPKTPLSQAYSSKIASALP